jgi:AcrR family transcriptional regulator
MAPARTRSASPASRKRTARSQRRRRRGAAATPDPPGTTEQKILDAAHAVFLRRGTSGARMQDIAGEAGVNQALLHYYFRSKERLSEAVFQRAAAQLLPRAIDVLASELAIEDKVARFIDLELDHLLRTPYLPGYIISELHHHPDRVRQLVSALTGKTPEDIGPTVVARLGAQLAAGVDAGRFRPITPAQFVVNLVSLCIFPFAARPMLMALFGLDNEGFEVLIRQRRGQLTDFVLGAMRP